MLSIVNNYFTGNLLNYWLDLIKYGSNFFIWEFFDNCSNGFIPIYNSGCPLVTWPFFFKVRGKSVHSVKGFVKLKNV